MDWSRRLRRPRHLTAVVFVVLSGAPLAAAQEQPVDEARLLSGIRQLTFAGKRAGEGYFSADGTKLVFQSEREPDNPFYQIYLLDLETGDTIRVSPGHGKTTCAWIHPDNNRVLFASTHDDPQARAKQRAEIDFRNSGQTRRYAWDYDEQFELYAHDLSGGVATRLTEAVGYDAEGSYSPDGSLIAFASNRHAYAAPLPAADAEHFERDKSYLMDIYIMNADGSNVRRLTDATGYDGGPFFSPDGQRICWRRFSPDGATAEIYTMKIDGTDERRLTNLGAMSWAPYYHPSGEYLIFATNVHGFANFELYLVDAEGRRDPVRVTTTDGFDGLPVFHPAGDKLAWTSNRTASGESQIFIAAWNHEAALDLLGLSDRGEPTTTIAARAPLAPGIPADLSTTTAAITADDVSLHVHTLASDRMAGRLTGTEGERLATDYVAHAFQQLGLKPAGDDGTYFQPFEFTAGVALDERAANVLTLRRGEQEQKPRLDEDFLPLAFSQTGRIEPTPIVFAGYGIVAPGNTPGEEYDSYVHLDVTGKWVMVFRFLPDDIPPGRRQELNRYASLRHKAMTARDKGAKGIIFVTPPNAPVRTQLVPLSADAALSGSSLAAVSISAPAAARWVALAGRDLKQLNDALDPGEPMMGFELPGLTLEADIHLARIKRQGRNVLAVLPAGEGNAAEQVVIGAHIDHLGAGPHSSSRDEDAGPTDIHRGADDNASGTAGVVEIAQWLTDQKRLGRLAMKRDILFAAWSGEELGLIGSSHFVKTRIAEPASQAAAHAHGAAPADPAGASPHADPSASPAIVAYLNMDMIGRYTDQLTVQGVGSAEVWRSLIERANAPVGLILNLQDDAYLPTDSTPFYAQGVPVLAAFTGVHEDYHKPSDTAEKLNYPAAADTARFVGLVARALAIGDAKPRYIAMQPPRQGESRSGLRAFLGTIPDYAQGDVKGLKLSGVSKAGPAEKAGLLAGDVIIELAGKTVENIYDYTYAIDALKIGEPVDIVVQRGDQRVTLSITPVSRD